MFPDAWQRLLKEIFFSEVSKELEEHPTAGHTYNLFLSRLLQAANISPVIHWWRNHYLTAVWMTNYSPAKCGANQFLKSHWFSFTKRKFLLSVPFRMWFALTNTHIATLSTWLLPVPAVLQTATSHGEERNWWKPPLCSPGCEQMAQQGKVFLVSKRSQTALPSGDRAPNASSHHFRHWKCYMCVTSAEKRHHCWKSSPLKIL